MLAWQFVIFQGILTSIAKESYFVIFQGGGGGGGLYPLSGSAHVKIFRKFTLKYFAYLDLCNMNQNSQKIKIVEP